MKLVLLVTAIIFTSVGSDAQELPKLKTQSLKILAASGDIFLGRLSQGLGETEGRVVITCLPAGFLFPEIREIAVFEKSNLSKEVGTFETTTLDKCYQLNNTVKAIVRKGHQAVLNLDPVNGTVISVSESDGDDWNGPLPECVDCRG